MKSSMLLLICLCICGCEQDMRTQYQHNKAEYVRHHSCVKQRLSGPRQYFNADSNQVETLPGTVDYECGGVNVFIDDDEEQP